MIIELDNISGACGFTDSAIWYFDVSKRKQNYDCNVVEIALINPNKKVYTDLKLFKKLLEYVFSKKHIQDNYVSLGLFETHIDFLNDDYYKIPRNKYLFCKDKTIPFASLFHKFIDYEMHFNKEKYTFRGAIFWEHLKKFDYQTQEQFEYANGENPYATDRYLIDKNNVDNFVANYMKSNEVTGSYCKNNFAISLSRFNEEFDVIGLRLVSMGNLYPLYEEIEQDFRHLNMTSK